jgi:hypothetical protein
MKLAQDRVHSPAFSSPPAHSNCADSSSGVMGLYNWRAAGKYGWTEGSLTEEGSCG